MRKLISLALLLSACGQEVPPEPKPQPHEISFCDYDIDGVCVVKENRFIDIDPEIISWGLNTLEYEVNFFYRGLDFQTLAEENGFRIKYRWANRNTEYQGTYSDLDTTANVYLREGENITPRMKCSDRYFVMLHEVLHFISDRYLEWNYKDGDVHNVDYIFDHWALLNNLPVDYSVEGRLYTMTWYMCDDLINQPE